MMLCRYRNLHNPNMTQRQKSLFTLGIDTQSHCEYTIQSYVYCFTYYTLNVNPYTARQHLGKRLY